MSHVFGTTLSTQIVWGDDQQEYIKKMVNENKYFIAETSIKRTKMGSEKVTVLCRLTTMAEQLLPQTACIIPTKQ